MRHEQLGVGELEVDNIVGSGAGPSAWRRKFYLNAALGSDGNDGLAFDRPLKTLTAADDKLTTAKKDLIILEESASAISLSSAYDWTYNMCGLIGTAQNKMNQRSRIGMSTAFTPFFTVSGYGNQFANIYTMHGTAAGDYVGWLISGARNTFENMHFGGPMVAAQGGHASYNGVNITGSENTFKNCVFGTNSIGRDELTPNVTLGAETITFFENCDFLLQCDDTDPYFVKVANSSGYTQAFFRNCRFHAFSPNLAAAAAVVFTFTAGSSADICLDINCSYNNVTNLAVTGSMKYIWMPRLFPATADEFALKALNTATY